MPPASALRIAATLLAGLLLFVAAAHAAHGSDGGPISVTYVANDGYLLDDGEHKVLIDSLFYLEGSKWHSPTPDMRDSMLAGKRPFNDIDVVVVTHAHRDHNDPELLASFLGRSRAALVAPPQAVEQLGDGAKERIFSASGDFYGSEELNVRGLKITTLTLHHVGGNRATQNMVVIFDFGGLTVLHAGDADLDDLYTADIPDVDVVMLSFWQGFDNEIMDKILKNTRAKHVIFKHSPYDSLAESAAKIEAGYGSRSTAYSLFRESFETVRYSTRDGGIAKTPSRMEDRP